MAKRHLTMEQSVVIVAGGNGARMQADLPKQFLLLAGKPILMHTIQRFFDYDAAISIVVVLPRLEIVRWDILCNEYNFTIPHKIVEGGETRFHSVKNGLAALAGNGLVAVHDGVRPLVSKKTIHNCYAEAVNSGAAIPVVTPVDSIRQITSEGSVVLNRDYIRMVQTPQVFINTILRAAYNLEYSPKFTDDASVVEMEGSDIAMVQGNTENIKITTPTDLLVAETLFQFVT